MKRNIRNIFTLPGAAMVLWTLHATGGAALAQTTNAAMPRNGQAPGNGAGTAPSAMMPTPQLKDLFGDEVIAKGKGFEIKRSQVETAVDNLKGVYAANGQPIPPEKVNLLEKQELQQLIGVQLILSQATDADKARAKEQFAKMLQKLKETSKLSDEEFTNKLERQLKIQGLTREQWYKQGAEEATVPVVVERVFKISATDDDARKYYEDHPSRFEVPERARASHILLATIDLATRKELTPEQKDAKRKLAEELLKRARAGEDFAKLAREYSDDPGSKDNGGEYTFPRGQMVTEFESAAFSLATNQISDIVTSHFGYHIIKVSEKLPAKKQTLAEVSDDLKEALSLQEVQKQIPDYLAKLKQDANVEILDEKYKMPENPAAMMTPATKPATNAPGTNDGRRSLRIPSNGQ